MWGATGECVGLGISRDRRLACRGNGLVMSWCAIVGGLEQGGRRDSLGGSDGYICNDDMIWILTTFCIRDLTSSINAGSSSSGRQDNGDSVDYWF